MFEMGEHEPARWSRGVRRLAILPLEAMIWLYRVTLSPLIGRQCRFEPTCSRYGLEALHELGPLKGSWVTMKRISRCHPFSKGGYDPVPPARSGAGSPDGADPG